MSAKGKINDDVYYASGNKLPKQNNYEIAYTEAVEGLAKRDLNDLAEKSGARIIDEDDSLKLLVPFIEDDIIITHPKVILYYGNKDDDVQLWLKILLLHYLFHAKGTPASGKQITFKQISGGLAYYPTFQKRAIAPILKKYSDNLDNFIISAEKIGGIRSFFNEYSITFRAFPRVNVTFNFWKGDEEFPTEGNVIFDSSIVDYLTTEDIVVLCNMIAVMIIK